MNEQIVTLEYRFKLPSGATREFVVHLQKPGLQLVSALRQNLPGWTRLTHHQCPNCPLDPKKHPHCPIATNLVDVIEAFQDCMSTEEADINIRTDSREYHRSAPLQHGISSLMGVHMAASGCPVMDKLRPMVYTHLPFATVEESMYRAVSMYLLAQYFLSRRGQTPDWNLEKLVTIYEDISQVNRAFVGRLLSINPKDASLNALVSLDCFASITAFSIVRDKLKEMECLFQAYLDVPVKD